MKIVIDLQGAQAENRFQGIGRYSLSLAKAIAANAGEHDVYIVLSKSLPGTIEDIRAAFQHVLPQERIVAFSVPDGTAALRCTSPFRARAAELLREQFLAGLKPDVVLLTSLFEGIVSDSVTSIGLLPYTYLSAVVLYDLIPLAMPQDYLRDEIRDRWYRRKLEHLKRADLALAISEFTKKDAARLLGMESHRMAVIGSAADGIFKQLDLAEHEQIRIRKRMGISKPFVLSVANTNEPRKNVAGLFQAFAMLPQDIKHRFQLVIPSSATKAEKDATLHQAREAGLGDGDVVLTGYVTDDDLVAMYNLCSLSVFPSLYEGFGLPVLEAMACGAPVICSSTTSLPEVMSCDEALFDPASPSAIAAKMTEVLADDAFADRLVGNGRRQVARFSWDRSAELALAAFEDALGRKNTSFSFAGGVTVTGVSTAKYVGTEPATVTDAATDAATDASTSTAKYVGTEPATVTDAVTDAATDAGTSTAKYVGTEPATATDAATDTGMGPVGGTEMHRASAHNASKPSLAFISPLPPDQTGIASYSAELVPALAEYYDIEVVTGHGVGSITGGGAHGTTIRTPQWFERNADRYDRVLYQMGNSPFHIYQ
ncbi:MAG: glycosyltransferase family 4 protein, partial [Actinobacteria bacterium]|nr:glycosyltransferase family 4 protein [Actinomycetota bacterium]